MEKSDKRSLQAKADLFATVVDGRQRKEGFRDARSVWDGYWVEVILTLLFKFSDAVKANYRYYGH